MIKLKRRKMKRKKARKITVIKTDGFDDVNDNEEEDEEVNDDTMLVTKSCIVVSTESFRRYIEDNTQSYRNPMTFAAKTFHNGQTVTAREIGQVEFLTLVKCLPWAGIHRQIPVINTSGCAAVRNRGLLRRFGHYPGIISHHSLCRGTSSTRPRQAGGYRLSTRTVCTSWRRAIQFVELLPGFVAVSRQWFRLLDRSWWTGFKIAALHWIRKGRFINTFELESRIPRPESGVFHVCVGDFPCGIGNNRSILSQRLVSPVFTRVCLLLPCLTILRWSWWRVERSEDNVAGHHRLCVASGITHYVQPLEVSCPSLWLEGVVRAGGAGEGEHCGEGEQAGHDAECPAHQHHTHDWQTLGEWLRRVFVTGKKGARLREEERGVGGGEGGSLDMFRER